MDEIKAFFKDLFSSTTERIKFPVINSILISWLIINWKIVLILFFSRESVENRIDRISNKYDDPWFNIWLPIIIGISYVIFFPIVKKLMFHVLVQMKKVNWNDEMDYQIASFDKQLLKADKELALQLKKADYIKTDQLTSKIQELENELNSKNIELTKSSEKIIELRDKVNDPTGVYISYLKVKEDFVDLVDKTSQEVREGISFENYDEIDGLKLLNFKHSFLYNIHWKKTPHVDSRNYIIAPSDVDDYAANGFGEVMNALKHENYTLKGVSEARINYAMRNDLIFKYTKDGVDYFGFTFRGMAVK